MRSVKSAPLTKNGAGNLIEMSMDAHEALAFESEVYTALREAEIEAALTEERYSPDEVFTSLRTRIDTVSGARWPHLPTTG